MHKILFKILLILSITAINILAESNTIIIDVEDYGAEVNDDIDDYFAIQKAIEALDQTKDGTLVFHKGIYDIKQHKNDNNKAVQKTVSTIYESKNHNNLKNKKKLNIVYLNRLEKNTKYKIASQISNFTFTNYNDLTIEGNGAIFNFDGDWTRTADYTLSNPNYTYSRHNAIGFEIINSTNVLIRNLELDGNADETVKEATTEGFSDGIMIGGSSYININNVYVHHYHADGLYIYAQKDNNGIKHKSEHIKVSNSRFKNNARQGCSVVGGRYIDFYHCAFSNTGRTGIYGFHNPMAGFDIEPHVDVKGNGNILFDKCNFDNNIGFAYVGSNSVSTPYPIDFKYCTFTNGKNTIWHQAVIPNSHKINFSYCLFNEISLWPNYAAKNKNGYVNVSVSRCKFKSRNIEQKLLLANDSRNLKWYIEKTVFQLDSKYNSSNTKSRFYLKNNKQIVFQSNTIKMSKEEYKTYRANTARKFILNGVNTYNTSWIKKSNILPSYTSKYGSIYGLNGISILYNTK